MCDSPMCSTGQLGNVGSPLSADPAMTAATMPADQMQALQRAGAFLGSPTIVPNRGTNHSEMFGRMLQAAEDFPAPKKYRGK